VGPRRTERRNVTPSGGDILNWTPRYKQGDQVRVDIHGGRYGIVLGYHSEDEDYLVLLLSGVPDSPDLSQCPSDEWWDTTWQSENALEAADNSFAITIPGLTDIASHVFLIGTPSALASVEVFAPNLTKLTEAHPEAEQIALGAVADPEEPLPLPNGEKKRSLRFAEVRGLGG
jgi:hypothetical protein